MDFLNSVSFDSISFTRLSSAVSVNNERRNEMVKGFSNEWGIGLGTSPDSGMCSGCVDCSGSRMCSVCVSYLTDIQVFIG